MTDTTYSYVRCRCEDAKHFENLGYELDREQRGVAELFDSCANYGNCMDLKKLSESGIIFYSWHGPGSEYAPCVQASDGAKFIDVSSDDQELPVVGVLENGTLDEEGLHSAREYWRVYRRARKAMGEVNDE